MRHRCHAILTAAAGLLSVVAPAGAQCMYDAIAIGEVPPQGHCTPSDGTWHAVNDFGLVGGYYQFCQDPLPSRPVLWSAETGLIYPTMPPPLVWGRIESINNAGDYCGRSKTAGSSVTDVSFIVIGGQWTILETLPGGTYITATAINDARQVVGFWANAALGTESGFLWENGVLTDLGPALGVPYSRVLHISECGQITGYFKPRAVTDPAHAFRYDLYDGTFEDLGIIPDGTFTLGTAIACSGYVVGSGWTTRWHAMFWNNTEMIVLDADIGWWESHCYDINRFGTICGSMKETPRSITRPLLWQNGELHQIVNLLSDQAQSLIAELQQTAWAIRDDGVILAGDLLLVPISPPGDVTRDCRVDETDLLTVLEDWGLARSPADLTGDGVVDHHDLAEVLAGWIR